MLFCPPAPVNNVPGASDRLRAAGYSSFVRADAQGHFRLGGLLPGLRYHLMVAGEDGKLLGDARAFTAVAGETVDLSAEK